MWPSEKLPVKFNNCELLIKNDCFKGNWEWFQEKNAFPSRLVIIFFQKILIAVNKSSSKRVKSF